MVHYNQKIRKECSDCDFSNVLHTKFGCPIKFNGLCPNNKKGDKK